MLQTLADTIRVLATCYTTAMGADSIYTINGRIFDDTTTTATAYTQFQITEENDVIAYITFNKRFVTGKSENWLRHVIVHELLHVYWYPLMVIFKKNMPDHWGLIEDLIENLATQSMWLKMCPLSSGRPPDR